MDKQTIRLKLFDWLHEQSLLKGHVFPWKQLATGFVIDGKVITLVGRTGIWTPAGFSMSNRNRIKRRCKLFYLLE